MHEQKGRLLASQRHSSADYPAQKPASMLKSRAEAVCLIRLFLRCFLKSLFF